MINKLGSLHRLTVHCKQYTLFLDRNIQIFSGNLLLITLCDIEDTVYLMASTQQKWNDFFKIYLPLRFTSLNSLEYGPVDFPAALFNVDVAVNLQ